MLVFYLWWELRCTGCIWFSPATGPKHQLNPSLAQLGACQCLQGHFGSSSSSLPAAGLKRALLPGQSAALRAATKEGFLFCLIVWFLFFWLFFKVDFSSTGASLGWESETELDGLRWAGRAQRGEASREARGICSFCSHLVDQRIVSAITTSRSPSRCHRGTARCWGYTYPIASTGTSTNDVCWLQGLLSEDLPLISKRVVAWSHLYLPLSSVS